jgi:hypothetical protein
MSHSESIRLARPVEVGEFTLRCQPTKSEEQSRKMSFAEKFKHVDGLESSVNRFRPYKEVLDIMKAKLSKEAILGNSPPAPTRRPQLRAFVNKSRSAMSETTLSLHKTTILNQSDMAVAAAHYCSNEPTAKKFQLKLHSTEVADFDLMSTLKLRHEKRRSKTYSQIHRDKNAFVRASQLGLTRYS